ACTQAAGVVDGGAVLGYGNAEGGPMKAQGGDDHGEYITGPDGERGISRIDEEQLETIAGELGVPRSEEHTSELQSRFDLVCRLLLEKKKREGGSRDGLGQ